MALLQRARRNLRLICNHAAVAMAIGGMTGATGDQRPEFAVVGGGGNAAGALTPVR
jgi:hypothetical protein